MVHFNIKGIGNDIVAIKRIKKIIDRYGMHFCKKILTYNELKYCLKHRELASFIAGRFAAKEAIAKALETGFGKWLSFLDMEILNDETGRPLLKYSNSLNDIFGKPRILLSISHCKEYATAFAIRM